MMIQRGMNPKSNLLTLVSIRRRCEMVIKLIKSQGEGYTTVCWLDYDYIKNHYRLIPVYFSRQQELDADLIIQKEFCQKDLLEK